MLYSRGALYTVRDLPASNGTEPGTLATRAQCAGRLLCHPPLQVCVPHGVVAWELGRAKSCDLGSENSRQGKIVLSGSTRTRGVQFNSINFFADTSAICADSGMYIKIGAQVEVHRRHAGEGQPPTALDGGEVAEHARKGAEGRRVKVLVDVQVDHPLGRVAKALEAVLEVSSIWVLTLLGCF